MVNTCLKTSLLLLLTLSPAVWGLIPRDPNGDGFIDTVLDQRQHVEKDGSFGFRYETENGIRNKMAGQNGPNGGTVMTGEYSYITPEGNTVHVQWTADERGYRPVVTITPPVTIEEEPEEEKVIKKRSHGRSAYYVVRPKWNPYSKRNLYYR